MVRRDAEEEPAARAGEPLSFTIERFEVLEVLGRGGMGIVYRARDPRLGREVAIKVLSAECKAPAELSAHQTIDLLAPGLAAHHELIAEARMMAQLSHPNVVAVYEVGLEGEAMFLVMEYVAGSNLRDWLASSTHERAELLEVFAQAGRGLAAAHACGIVHRDFKPENVLVGADRRVRVADFGLSRLVRAPGALIRVTHERGTPEYMAPELWQGGAATERSDAFAFCTALVEGLLGQRPGELAAVEPGLRERGVPGDLSAAIRAGLDDDPARRPELSRLVDLLDDHPRRPRRWILAIAGGAVTAIAVAVMPASTTIPACTDDPALLADRWDAEHRGKLASYLHASTAPAAVEGAERVLAILDGHARDIAAVRTATCAAARNGELAAAQVVTRMSCLERRAISLGIAAQHIPDRKLDLDAAARRAQQVPYVAACAELTAPPIQDPARAAALQVRDHAIPQLTSREERAQAYAELEREARAAGEVEVEIRAALGLALTQRDADRITTADETLQRAYRRALDAQAEGLAARALVERANLAAKHTPAAAASTAQLALALAERPGVSPRTRARIYGSLGRAALARGDAVVARDSLRRALDVIETHGQLELGGAELDMRFDLVRALLGLDVRQALDAAQTAVAFAERTSGKHSANYGTALNMLAVTLWQQHDFAQALRYRRQSLEVLSAALPADHSRVVTQRINLSWDLLKSGDYVTARRESTAALAQSDRNEALRGSRPEVLYLLAMSTFGAGEYEEGTRLAEEAVMESTSRFGKDHPTTLFYLHFGLLDTELELGRFDALDKHVAILEQAYEQAHRLNPQLRDTRPTLLRGVFAAELAIARGKPRDGEALARAALAELDSRKDDHAREIVSRVLGRALVAQRRWADAKAVLEETLAQARVHLRRPDHLANIEILLAQAEVGSGARDAGIGRARRAREVLAKGTSQPRASAEVAAFLAKHDRPARGARPRPRAGGVGDDTARSRPRPR